MSCSMVNKQPGKLATPVMRLSDALSQALMRLRDSLMSCRYTVVAGYSGSCSPQVTQLKSVRVYCCGIRVCNTPLACWLAHTQHRPAALAQPVSEMALCSMVCIRRASCTASRNSRPNAPAHHDDTP